MTSETLEIIKLIIATLLGGAISFAVQHYRRPADVKDDHERNTMTITKTSTETIAQLITQVNGLIEQDEKREERINKLQKQIEELERTNKTYINAYNRAFTFIRKRVPVEEIPDFMITQDLRPLADKQLK